MDTRNAAALIATATSMVQRLGREDAVARARKLAEGTDSYEAQRYWLAVAESIEDATMEQR